MSFAPIIFPLFAFGMCWIPIICGLSAWRTKKRGYQSEEYLRYTEEPIVYSGDYTLDADPSSQIKETRYCFPSQCPMCKTTIGSEEIGFVEPRQTECPECGATIDAKERE